MGQHEWRVRDGARLPEIQTETSGSVYSARSVRSASPPGDGLRVGTGSRSADVAKSSERRRDSAKDRGGSRLSETFVVVSDALAGLAAERSLANVLQRIADLAREVVGARYAALGVSDANGRILQFITSGLTPQERAAIGPAASPFA